MSGAAMRTSSPFLRAPKATWGMYLAIVSDGPMKNGNTTTNPRRPWSRSIFRVSSKISPDTRFDQRADVAITLEPVGIRLSAATRAAVLRSATVDASRKDPLSTNKKIGAAASDTSLPDGLEAFTGLVDRSSVS